MSTSVDLAALSRQAVEEAAREQARKQAQQTAGGPDNGDNDDLDFGDATSLGGEEQEEIGFGDDSKEDQAKERQPINFNFESMRSHIGSNIETFQQVEGILAKSNVRYGVSLGPMRNVTIQGAPQMSYNCPISIICDGKVSSRFLIPKCLIGYASMSDRSSYGKDFIAVGLPAKYVMPILGELEEVVSLDKRAYGKKATSKKTGDYLFYNVNRKESERDTYCIFDDQGKTIPVNITSAIKRIGCTIVGNCEVEFRLKCQSQETLTSHNQYPWNFGFDVVTFSIIGATKDISVPFGKQRSQMFGDVFSKQTPSGPVMKALRARPGN